MERVVRCAVLLAIAVVERVVRCAVLLAIAEARGSNVLFIWNIDVKVAI